MCDLELKWSRLPHFAVLLPIILFIFAGCEKKWWDVAPFSSRVVTEWPADTTIYLGNKSQIVITAVGDIMVHGPQLRAQFNAAAGSYDFSNNFRWVSSYLLLSDIAIGNLETTFAGGERPYAGFPLFNSPDELARDLRLSGFDILVTANNHSIDTGIAGLRRTAQVVRRNRLTPLGTRSSSEQPAWELREIRGIRVALTAWTYETPRLRGERSINGLPLPSRYENLINSFNFRELETDFPRMQQQIEEMQATGADILIFYMHWGDEYVGEPNADQRLLASMLSEKGVDIIFGTHPHVVQPVEFINETLVVWSMGNFLSNQRYESLQRREVEDGLMVSVLIEKDHDGMQTSIKEVLGMSTWTHRYWSGGPDGRLVYQILPSRNVLASPDYFGIEDADLLRRIQRSADRTDSLLTAGVRSRQERVD